MDVEQSYKRYYKGIHDNVEDLFNIEEGQNHPMARTIAEFMDIEPRLVSFRGVCGPEIDQVGRYYSPVGVLLVGGLEKTCAQLVCENYAHDTPADAEKAFEALIRCFLNLGNGATACTLDLVAKITADMYESGCFYPMPLKFSTTPLESWSFHTIQNLKDWDLQHIRTYNVQGTHNLHDISNIALFFAPGQGWLIAGTSANHGSFVLIVADWLREHGTPTSVEDDGVTRTTEPENVTATTVKQSKPKPKPKSKPKEAKMSQEKNTPTPLNTTFPLAFSSDDVAQGIPLAVCIVQELDKMSRRLSARDVARLHVTQALKPNTLSEGEQQLQNTAKILAQALELVVLAHDMTFADLETAKTNTPSE